MALCDDAAEFGPQRRQVFNLAIDLGEMSAGNSIDGLATHVPLVGESEQLLDLFQREAERTGPPDEAETPEVVGVIDPVIAVRSRRWRKQSDAFVIADRLDLGAGGGGEFADSERGN